MAIKHSYQKPWLKFDDQISLLQSRGLIINDIPKATEFLMHVNYYRFSGYCLAFESSRHSFVQGVTFEHIIEAYEFDRFLRDLVTEALEIVELDFRTTVAYHFGQKYGAFGHINPGNFFCNRNFDHTAWTEKLHSEAERSSELFVEHFKKNYHEFPDLPIWVITELMSFGSISHMCNGLLKADAKVIAYRYGLQPMDWMSWMHHLTYVRNLCAHHSRLWDRIWSIKPLLPAAMMWKPPFLPNNNRLFVTLLILNFIMKRCPAVKTYSAHWRGRIEKLLQEPPLAPDAIKLMGLTENWKKHPAWN
jgi:abortive infection bacteriophage resistance protein